MRKNKLNKKTEQTVKKSRAKYDCPEGIDGFLEKINRELLPKVYLPDVETILGENRIIYPPDVSDEEKLKLLYETKKKVLYDCYKDFNENCRNEIYGGERRQLPERPSVERYELGIAGLSAVLDNYKMFREQRNWLQSIARFFARLRAGDNFYEGKTEIETNDGEILKLPMLPPVPLSREGTIGKIDSEILKELDGCDLDRIRECVICSRLLWAENKNSFTCSSTCRNALRQRRHREKNKEKINAKRRDNYDRNKKLKEMRKKKNGTL